MSEPTLHELAAAGDRVALQRRLDAAGAAAAIEAVNAVDRDGRTPLMHALASARADAALVRMLLAYGARHDLLDHDEAQLPRSLLRVALAHGDPAKVEALVDAGADIHYRAEHGYDALLDAVHGRDVCSDARLIDLLVFLIGRGCALSSVTTYKESALRVLSRLGRFDAVKVLLDAGADAAQLGWTALHRAVALGSPGDVEQALRNGAPLEDPDGWSRTALHVALQSGDLDKVTLLARHGADASARARCGKPSLHFAVETHRVPVLDWVLANGAGVDDTDEFGETALMLAAQEGDVEMVRALLAAGADLEREHHGATALGCAGSAAVARCLLEAGADPSRLSQESRRLLVGLPRDADRGALAAVPAERFARARSPRFGTANPEPMKEPFWNAMIRAGVSGYEATQWFSGPTSLGATPVWCAQRYGQSLTFLPDGRIVQVGGEHEDYYDPDFCIYNDVFVHDRAGGVTIFGYPSAIFPPTDFHTATLLGPTIYLIGSLGYADARQYGHTPVFRLDTRDFRVERLATTGDAPGWIYKHRAAPLGERAIRVWGGTIVTATGTNAEYTDNLGSYVLDLDQAMWRREPP